MPEQTKTAFRFPLKWPACRDAICRFLASPYYIFAVMVLTAASNLFGWEFMTYSLFVSVAVFCCLCGKDLLPLMPLVFSGYIAPSLQNNPGRNPDSIFFLENGGAFLVVLAVILVASLAWFVIQHKKQYFSKKPRLLIGMLALSGSYLLSGLFSSAIPEFLGSNLLFALIQSLSLLVPYWVLYNGVNWKQAPKDYFCWIGLATGFTLILEILGIYLTQDVIVDGIIDRSRIYTGWGMYNNIGAMLAMMIPFPFYFALKRENRWIGIGVGSLFLAGVILTCSRTSIVTGTCIFFCCLLFINRHMIKLELSRQVKLIIGGILLVLIFVCCAPLLQLFSNLLALGADPSSRDILFRDGIDLFRDYPIFGGSFFSPEKQAWGWSTVESFSKFFPPRWHNTFVQILASCGLVGFFAYIFHRLQTIKLFLSKRSLEHSAIGLSILTLLLCSLFDCHFFNIGPVLFYSMALAFAERLHTSE